MTDDPREILKAAGVECVEVDEYMAVLETEACPECGMFFFRSEQDLDAILALARLVRGPCATCRWYVMLDGGIFNDPACTKREVADLYGDGDEIAEVELLSWWGSGNEYLFRPAPDFGCNRWELRDA